MHATNKAIHPCACSDIFGRGWEGWDGGQGGLGYQISIFNVLDDLVMVASIVCLVLYMFALL